MFTNFRYHNLGVPKNSENPFYEMPPLFNPDGENFVDTGLGGFLKSAGFPPEVYEPEIGKQKVPTLRNVDLRPSSAFTPTRTTGSSRALRTSSAFTTRATCSPGRLPRCRRTSIRESETWV